ncbi:MAG: DUF3421 domain-containing protein [Thermoanaerobaculia bacterium]
MKRLAGVFVLCAVVAASTEAQEVFWAKGSSGLIPRGALVAGTEPGNPELYLCRADYRGGVHPGKVVASRCNIGWGDKEIVLSDFEVLLASASSVEWVPASLGEIPIYALPAGSEPNRPVLYACRAEHSEGWHPGKVVGAHCSIGYGGREYRIDEYEVLTTPPRWQSGTRGSFPEGALSGGWEPGRPDLYVCRARYADGDHPGKLVGSYCNIGWGRKEHALADYEVLVAPAELAQWIPGRDGEVPRGAFVGGSEPSRDLYVCRAEYEGGVHPGKLVERHCNIGYGGYEVMMLVYEVLVLE